jgi:type IV pilus assembly protein PilC
MPLYAYQAIDRFGAKDRGTLEAANENELFMALRGQGFSLVDCHVHRARNHGRAVPLGEQAVFCRHVQAMVQAGIPLTQALGDIAASGLSGRIAEVMPQIMQRMMAGQTLSSVFAGLNLSFDPLFTFMLRAGEKTGFLAQNLEKLQRSLEWKDHFQKEMRKSLSYPLMQLLLAMLAVTVLVGVAIPQIIKLLDFMGNDLPWYASAIIALMNVLGWVFTALAVFGAGTALLLPLARSVSEPVREATDRLALRLPLVGPVLLKSSLAQIAHLFSSMLESGVQVMEALDLLPQMVSNRALAADLARVREKVGRGCGLTEAFEQDMALPVYVLRLIKAGEDGGDIRESLNHIADLYQSESRQAVDALMKGSSLAITLLVGSLLAAMVIGVIYPLYHGISLMVAG